MTVEKTMDFRFCFFFDFAFAFPFAFTFALFINTHTTLPNLSHREKSPIPGCHVTGSMLKQ